MSASTDAKAAPTIHMRFDEEEERFALCQARGEEEEVEPSSLLTGE